TADGQHVALSIITENHFWRALCDVLGLTDVRDLDFVERMARLDELQARIADAIARHERDTLVEQLLAADAPAAPVLDRHEMLALDHFRDHAVSTSDPWAATAAGYPVRFRDHPARRVAAPPTVDAHADADFGTVDIRPLTPADEPAVEALVTDGLGHR